MMQSRRLSILAAMAFVVPMMAFVLLWELDGPDVDRIPLQMATELTSVGFECRFVEGERDKGYCFEIRRADAADNSFIPLKDVREAFEKFPPYNDRLEDRSIGNTAHVIVTRTSGRSITLLVDNGKTLAIFDCPEVSEWIGD